MLLVKSHFGYSSMEGIYSMLTFSSLHLVHFCKVLYCWGKNTSTTCSFTLKKVLDCVIYCLPLTVTPHSELRLPALYFISSYRGPARHVLTFFPICCKYPYKK